MKARLEAILLTVDMGILFGIALAVLSCGDIVAGYPRKILDVPFVVVGISRILAWPLAFAIVAVAFAIVYYIAPDIRQAKWKWITPGSVVGIGLWLVSSLALRVLAAGACTGGDFRRAGLY